MIVIKVEFWPKGNPQQAELLGEMKIWNEEKPLAASGATRYGFVARARRTDEVNGSGVEHFREQPVWDLLYRVLSHSAFGRRRTLPTDDRTSAVRAPRMPEADEDSVRI